MLRPTRPLLLIAPVVLTLASIACGGGDSKGGGLLVATVAPQSSGQPAGAGGTQPGGGANNAQPTQAPASNSGGSSGGSASSGDVAALLTNFAKVKSFRATVTTGGSNAATATMEIVQPDKMHLTTAAAGQNIEIITIGNDTYTKVAGQWMKRTGSGGANFFDPKSIQDSLKTASADEKAVIKGGTDTVDGKKCQIYTNNAGGNATDVCIADGLPVKVTTKTGATTTTIIFKDYNANIDIKAPI